MPACMAVSYAGLVKAFAIDLELNALTIALVDYCLVSLGGGPYVRFQVPAPGMESSARSACFDEM